MEARVPPPYPGLCGAARGSGDRPGGGPGGGGRGPGRGAPQLAHRAAVLVRQVLQQRVLPQPQRLRRALAAGGAGPATPRAPQALQAVPAEAVAAGQRDGPGQQPLADDAAQVVLRQPHGHRQAVVQARHGPRPLPGSRATPGTPARCDVSSGSSLALPRPSSRGLLLAPPLAASSPPGGAPRFGPVSAPARSWLAARTAQPAAPCVQSWLTPQLLRWETSSSQTARSPLMPQRFPPACCPPGKMQPRQLWGKEDSIPDSEKNVSTRCHPAP